MSNSPLMMNPENADFWPQVVEFCQALTARVGTTLLKEFSQVQREQKADGSLVTSGDRWADQELTAAIQKAFPDHGILSEEGNPIFPAEDWAWIIDPIDGTTNFAHGLPIWCVALALCYKGYPVFGYVAVPPLGQNFHGFWQAPNYPDGAFLNGQPIQTSSASPGPQEFFSLCARSTAVISQASLSHLGPIPAKIRMLGSASYNFLTVAAGYTLGAVEKTPQIWDIAPAWPIVKAANGAVIWLNQAQLFPLIPGQSLHNQPQSTLMAANPNIGDYFLPWLNCLTCD
ncbi:inositol monophosphatase family protein [Thermosynechococcaceae cyanobacterium BACA0444]|uniref:Inositol monophosphatase family protein n=1 Tax=Pseudocalidococcus azoricus BACA0444 TaxID=2918990 RepID=A0AAE4FUD1_9CYAN|nr:inositol monophosphatase family protein [Pseudocalidococcus azoricus]MDS3861564.1 inositol monophosphatase family protein [Pseudocalidococcus azoricus BACA0444]